MLATLLKVSFLGAVDAINPCVLSIFAFFLILITTYNPQEKRKVLTTGFTFTGTVFVVYLIYGFLIISFFKFISSLAPITLILYKILGFVAIALGLLQIKDFFWYKPGCLLAEMPSFLRPKIKKFITEITSWHGGIGIGALATFFLIPCTMGPLFILGGILSAFQFLKALPWLILYNLIFVMPMVGITLAVWAGTSEIERRAKAKSIHEWRRRKVRWLHLVAGSIIFCLGIAMIMEFI